MPKLLGRDPALWLALVAVGVKLATALGWHASADVQTAVNTTAAAVVGVVVAFMVRDGQVAAILGAFQAGIALLLGLGFHLSADLQAGIMSAVAVALALITRTQVSALVPQIPAVVEPKAVPAPAAAPVIPAPPAGA